MTRSTARKGFWLPRSLLRSARVCVIARKGAVALPQELGANERSYPSPKPRDILNMTKSLLWFRDRHSVEHSKHRPLML